MKFSGDKSISHRALMLAALCDGETIIHNISRGEDIHSTIKCLRMCGVDIDDNSNKVIIKGGTLTEPTLELNCENSGTTARLLLGLLAGQKISATIIGDPSLSSRPMDRLTIPLELMGSQIKNNNCKLPLTIKTDYLMGINYILKISSAQVKSAILLAGLGANNITSISEVNKSRDHTEIMMDQLGIDISAKNNIVKIKKLEKKINPFEIFVSGDPSTASFFAAAALLLKKEIVLEDILLNPTRLGFFYLIEKMGAKIEFSNEKMNFGEKIGNIKIKPSNLNAIEITESMIPSIIDELPIISILAANAVGTTKVSGAKELRYKECDRIEAICYNLKNMGVEILENDDGFEISKKEFNGATIKTYDDHRIAMAFTIAGLISNGENKLDNKDCVKISCPNFYDLLKVNII